VVHLFVCEEVACLDWFGYCVVYFVEFIGSRYIIAVTVAVLSSESNF
jgi:hypothetical protein